MFRRIRITLLLIILFFVGFSTYQQLHNVASWDKPLILTIYPMNGDRTASTETYIKSISLDQFTDILNFMESEAKAYGITQKPLFYLYLGDTVQTLPPAAPGSQSNKLAIVSWSLKLRYWLALNASTLGLDSRHIRIFIAYHQGKKKQPLAHSYGLQKGLLGVVHAYASDKQAKQNNVVIAHELLHILGATDKYGPRNLPIFPDGFAEPEKQPLFPQEYAEIMGGRIPKNDTEAVTPASLDYCIIGPHSAAEINWRPAKVNP